MAQAMMVDLSKRARIKDQLELIQVTKELITVMEDCRDRFPTMREQMTKQIGAERTMITLLNAKIRRIASEPVEV